MKTMDYNNNGDVTYTGLLLTGFFWFLGKITLNDGANIMAIVSAAVVIIVNLPKFFTVLKNFKNKYF